MKKLLAALLFPCVSFAYQNEVEVAYAQLNVESDIEVSGVGVGYTRYLNAVDLKSGWYEEQAFLQRVSSVFVYRTKNEQRRGIADVGNFNTYVIGATLMDKQGLSYLELNDLSSEFRGESGLYKNLKMDLRYTTVTPGIFIRQNTLIKLPIEFQRLTVSGQSDRTTVIGLGVKHVFPNVMFEGSFQRGTLKQSNSSEEFDSDIYTLFAEYFFDNTLSISGEMRRINADRAVEESTDYTVEVTKYFNEKFSLELGFEKVDSEVDSDSDAYLIGGQYRF